MVPAQVALSGFYYYFASAAVTETAAAVLAISLAAITAVTVADAIPAVASG